MNIYLDLEELDRVPYPQYATTSDIMRISGNNTGNFAFRHALKIIVNELPNYKICNWATAQDLINRGAQVEKVILSCANWLGLSEQDERSNLVRAKILENLDSQIVAFGLGAQASSASSDVQLGPNTLRLARIISKKSVSVSVRDEFTKDLLNREGIYNVVVTGCPSNFINTDSEFISKLKERINFSGEKSFANRKHIIGEFSGGNKHSGEILKSTLEFMRQFPSFYAIQSPVLYPFYLNENDELPSPYIANRPSSYSPEECKQLLKQKMIGFQSMDSWLDFSRTCDISFGMRIHGNMIPLQAGVPAVLIAHDSRTSGLGSVMSIPKVSAAEFAQTKIDDVSNLLLSRFKEGLGEYTEKREFLREVFRNFINENGFTTKL
ncbi:polysaccharide pyruvyl transferase family protein [Alteromonas macleodii]|uniref:polysaccharide pyruvyl transferase family protein n=1 Tax=Alteromonas macleodii TaxID=28108 RepID=UPI00313FEF8D